MPSFDHEKNRNDKWKERDIKGGTVKGRIDRKKNRDKEQWNQLNQ